MLITSLPSSLSAAASLVGPSTGSDVSTGGRPGGVLLLVSSSERLIFFISGAPRAKLAFDEVHRGGGGGGVVLTASSSSSNSLFFPSGQVGNPSNVVGNVKTPSGIFGCDILKKIRLTEKECHSKQDLPQLSKVVVV